MCGGSQPRITLIEALFPQGSAAEIFVNPNKIGSATNGTLNIIYSRLLFLFWLLLFFFFEGSLPTPLPDCFAPAVQYPASTGTPGG